MQHFLKGDNIGLIIKRQGKFNFSYVFLAKNIVEGCLFESAYANNTVCPLYLYSKDGIRIPNFDSKIAYEVKDIVGEYTPEELFDYIYAILHSPKYRERYKEFLKIDFPRIPYPSNRKMFDEYAKYGKKLRELHLMESPLLAKASLPYPISGTDGVEKIVYKDNKVFINETQYFGNVSEIAWNFYIGGYHSCPIKMTFKLA